MMAEIIPIARGRRLRDSLVQRIAAAADQNALDQLASELDGVDLAEIEIAALDADIARRRRAVAQDGVG